MENFIKNEIFLLFFFYFVKQNDLIIKNFRLYFILIVISYKFQENRYEESYQLLFQ